MGFAYRFYMQMQHAVIISLKEKATSRSGAVEDLLSTSEKIKLPNNETLRSKVNRGLH